MVDKYTAQFNAAIVSIAEALKQPAEYVYNILVKQQYVKASIGLVIFIFVLLCITMSISFAKNVSDWDDGEVYEGKNRASAAFTIIFGVIGAIMLIVFFAAGYFSDILQGF